MAVVVGVRAIVDVRVIVAVSVRAGEAVSVEVSVGGIPVVRAGVAVAASPPLITPHARLETRMMIKALNCFFT